MNNELKQAKLSSFAGDSLWGNITVAVENEVEIKQIKLGRHSAMAIRAAMLRIDQLKVEFDRAATAYQAALNIHQEHVAGVIRDGGYDLNDFANYSLHEENGEAYLRAQRTVTNGVAG